MNRTEFTRDVHSFYRETKAGGVRALPKFTREQKDARLKFASEYSHRRAFESPLPDQSSNLQ
jgi:hypothetical protein